MRQLIATEWVSLDGVFDAGSMEQWFNPYHSDSRAACIQGIIADCDAMLYGRKTYEMLFPYWSKLENNEMGVADKLNKVRKYVVSSTLREAPWENTTIIASDVVRAIDALKKEKGGNILIQGSGELTASLLKAGLVDQLKLLVQPHIMGTGARLFPGTANKALELVGVQQLDKGVLVLTYTPVKK